MKDFAITLLASFAVVAAVISASAADDPKGQFEGVWELVSVEKDGEPLKVQPNSRLVVIGDSFTLKVGDKLIVAGTSKFNSTTKPKSVDTTYTEGPDAGKTIKGIFELDGDTSRFCRAGTPEQDRPIEFKTKPGTGGLASVYKRVKQ